MKRHHETIVTFAVLAIALSAVAVRADVAYFRETPEFWLTVAVCASLLGLAGILRRMAAGGEG